MEIKLLRQLFEEGVRDNHVKHYRSLVGAIADAKHIGFQEIKLIIP